METWISYDLLAGLVGALCGGGYVMWRRVVELEKQINSLSGYVRRNVTPDYN